jgi:DNA-directed RNA polymerase specialized sigma24 family protein
MDRIFRDNMSELYWLAFLLTGDRERSVEAFAGALNSEAPDPTLQRFLLSWARRLVIVAALGTIRSQLRESVARNQPATAGELKGLAQMDPADRARLTKSELEEALLAMDVFPRCAVILTLLEGLPVKEAASLLGVDERTVKAAQARGVTEMTWRIAGATRPVTQLPFRLGQTVMALAATS